MQETLQKLADSCVSLTLKLKLAEDEDKVNVAKLNDLQNSYL